MLKDALHFIFKILNLKSFVVSLVQIKNHTFRDLTTSNPCPLHHSHTHKCTLVEPQISDFFCIFYYYKLKIFSFAAF